MGKVAITTTSFAEFDNKPLRLVEAAGHEIVLNPYGRKLKKEETIEICRDVIGIVAGTETIDNDVLEKSPALKVVSRCGTGIDNVDLNAARELGIKVFNTPDAPTLAVAELTVALVLNLLRKVGQMDRGIRRDRWQKLMGNLLHGKKAGIIGFGKIGQRVGLLLDSLGCEVCYCDVKEQECGSKYPRFTLGDLLGASDIVSLHVSGKYEKPLLAGEGMKLMRKGSWLINVSRGGAVDEDALYTLLKSGHLAGAALDVFEQEPYTGPLKELDNVILSPHIGSYAKEARIMMETQAVENLLKGLGQAS